jgi:hypothetical protein
VTFRVGKEGGAPGTMQITATVKSSGGAVLGSLAASQATTGWAPTAALRFTATSTSATLILADTSLTTTATDVALDSVAVVPIGPVADNLIAYYPFNGNADDESGNGYNGTVPSESLIKDRFGIEGSALQIDRTSTTNYHPNIIINSFSVETDEITASLWVMDNSPSTSQGVRLLDDSWIKGSFVLGLWTNAQPLFMVNNGTAFPGILGTQPLSKDNWSHIVATAKPIDNGQSLAKIYINGKLDNNFVFNGKMTHSSGTLYVGGIDAFDHKDFRGFLDDIRIYNRALSDQEVQDMYAYEAAEPPSLSINVKTVQVMMNVRPTKQYQLESSLDLIKWTKAGEPFLASSSTVTQEFNTIEVGRYFRLSEVQ